MIRNRKELYQYLNTVDWHSKKDSNMSSVYFLITYNGKTEPIYFMSYEGVYFESPCELHKFPMNECEIDEYVKELYTKESFQQALEYEKAMHRGNWHYDIDCPQCAASFLPEKLDDIKMISESECLEWLIKHSK